LFPDEIRQVPQWICWRYALVDNKPTKLPINPFNGQLASVTQPNSWSDYSTACKSALNSSGYLNGIGFVLTDNDPYCFIDFDNPGEDKAIAKRHVEIVGAFDTYTEVSPSGEGLHSICKAKVPGGRRRNKIEIYSSGRYMTMTGVTFLDRPIADRQDLAMRLWHELDNTDAKKDFSIIQAEQLNSDEVIFKIAREAENGEKFDALWRGEWTDYYKSQSEADFALINIIGFYSRNIEQIHRMFLLSALGKRDKARRKNYVIDMIRRSFDNQPVDIPLDAIKQSVANQLAKLDAEKDKAAAIGPPTNPFAALPVEIPDPNYEWTMPPGLLGEITEFIYKAAPRPVKEIALAAAIGLMAGICGRAYNVSSTGLNQYVLILARTGTGKEAAASGIDKIMQAVQKTVPAAMEFIGPADIASGQALIRYLDKHPCFVSIVGEFGLALQEMCSINASSSQETLRKNLLKLYNKSGQNDALRQTIYADDNKNTKIVKSPAFSILGESTPEAYYVNMDETMIAQGLMPRFTCIEYLGDRPPLNRDHNEAQPSESLVSKVCQVSQFALMLAHHNRTIDISLDSEAQELSAKWNAKCDMKINGSDFEVARQLWNRGHIKALKLAGLIAIGNNAFAPIITKECLQWAVNLIERDIINVLKKFETGKAGRDTGELNQINEVIHIISDYIKRPHGFLKQYQVDEAMHKDRVFSRAYVQRRLLSKGSFKNDRIGGISAIKRALDSLAQEGVIREMREIDVYKYYGRTMKSYIVIDVTRFG
jgi:hypothetical protein